MAISTNGVLAGAIGVTVAALAYVFAFPSIDPSIWREVASATGLRPDGEITPAVWKMLVGLGVPLKVIGSVGIGIFACAFFDALRRMFLVLVTARRFPQWRSRTVPMVALVGMSLAVFSDPVWRLALMGGSALVELALLAVAVDLFMTQFFVDPATWIDDDDDHYKVWWKAQRAHWGTYLSFFITGILAVETPMALVLPIAFVIFYSLMCKSLTSEEVEPLLPEMKISLPPRFENWGAFLCVAAGAVGTYVMATVWVGDWRFFHYAVGACKTFLDAASVFGWMLWIGLSLIPCLFTLGVLWALTRHERRLDFSLGLLALGSGLLAYGQVSPVSSTWFWCLLSGVKTVSSPLMLALATTLAAVAVAATLALFSYHTVHAIPAEYPVLKSLPWFVGGVLALLVFGAATTVPRDATRRLRMAIAAVLDETAHECEGLNWIFTDGMCDAGLELAAVARGQTLHALPLIARKNAGSDALRLRGIVDKADRKSVGLGSAVLLRDWIATGSSNLNASAIQLGFDLWRCANRPQPDISGLVARPGGFAPGERERGIAAAERLADELLALSRMNVVANESDPHVRDAFGNALWRLARMMRARGNVERADELDDENVVMRRIHESVRRERSAAFLKMTDDEGLSIALRRADFGEAQRFAVGVLKRDPRSPAANFAIGMNHLLSDRLDDARHYLEAAHAAQPEEPAFLNNLAILYMKKGLFVEAIRSAEEAFRLAPDIPEVKDTLARVRKESKKASQGKDKR